MKIKRSSIQQVFVLGGLLSLAAIGSTFPSLPIAYLSLGLFFVHLVLIGRGAPEYFLISIPLQFLFSTEVLSTSIIESGAYMYEVAQTGTVTGATSRLAFTYCCFFSAALVLYENIGRAFPKYHIRNTRHLRMASATIQMGSTLIILYFFYLGYQNGFPLLTEQDRFSYRRGIENPVFTTLFGNRYPVAFLLGISGTIGSKWISRSVFSLLLIASILFGEKFTSIVLSSVFFFIPFWIERIRSSEHFQLQKLVFLGVLLILLTLPVILLVYGARDSLENAFEQLASRVSVQGQMWFVADRDSYFWVSPDVSQFLPEIASFVNANTFTLSYGRYFAMAPYVSSELLSWVMEIDQGFVFTLLPSWLLLYGGLAAQLLLLFTAIPTALCFHFATYSIHSYSLILALFAIKAYSWLIAGFVNGYSFHIFGARITMMLFALSVLILIFSRRIKQ